MVISAVARAATKILTKQKYAKTASVWRKENPDKIKAQKKRYYEVHKEQLLKEQKQYRKDNPVIKPKLTDTEKKIKNKAYAKSREGKVDKRFKGSGGKWADRVSIRKSKPVFQLPRKKRSDAGVKRGSYRLQEFTSKPTSSKYPSEQEQWRIVMSSKDVVGSSLLPSFLKGYGKTKVPKRILKSTQLKRKYGFGYEKRKYNLWLESHPTHKRILSLGGVFGGLAAYANWGRGENRS